MKSFIRVFLFLLFPAVCSAQSSALSIQSVATENTTWHLNQLSATQQDKGVLVSGNALPGYGALLGQTRGHIDVAVYGPDQRLLSEETVSLYPADVRRARQDGGVRFRVLLNTPVPSGSVVKVAYHAASAKANSAPRHRDNIAVSTR